MTDNYKAKITLILPSLSPDGLERVITELAWYFSKQEEISVSLISLSKGDFYFLLPSNIQVISPSFGIKETLRPFFLLKLMVWLRKKVRFIDPDALLSFGGRYNSFVLLSVNGLRVRTYISDRSRPSISYGCFLDRLNTIMYKKASGIITQTERAKQTMSIRIAHPNIKVIGNPVKISSNGSDHKENIIINVGRLISTKRQNLLIEYFAKINPEGWIVVFLGVGPDLRDLKSKVQKLKLEEKIIFKGHVRNIDDYLNKSKIFAFTSSSEGFPNALCEAMAAGLACISFDCEAGPSDLIEDGKNGFLVPENNHEDYLNKLNKLIKDGELRNRFGVNAKIKVLKYNTELIGDQFLQFMTRL
jgi:GalNAc-alpha-(1->4)-GalNAc-alpha-(1->3)-diNAcBac-PP-undecaprenol alpha-1,4-N-acetyl-D-galactosaminyltransferase